MPWQRYTDETALERMAEDCCPECGYIVESHDGGGGPYGCSLTDNGVAGRIYQYKQDQEATVKAPESDGEPRT